MPSTFKQMFDHVVKAGIPYTEEIFNSEPALIFPLYHAAAQLLGEYADGEKFRNPIGLDRWMNYVREGDDESTIVKRL